MSGKKVPRTIEGYQKYFDERGFCLDLTVRHMRQTPGDWRAIAEILSQDRKYILERIEIRDCKSPIKAAEKAFLWLWRKLISEEG